MKKSISIVLAALVLAGTGCSSKEEANKTQNQAAPASTAPAPPAQSQSSAALPPGHPPMTQSMPAQPQSMQAPSTLGPGQGKVLQVTHASGYTYMEVDINGVNTWIAATALKVKTGDTVHWQDASEMQNFTSKTLRRTFDKILFVSNAQVAE